MPLYMRKDSHGYKFVRLVPTELRAQLGKANFIKRLGRDYGKAKTACAEFAVETNRLLAEARNHQANQDAVGMFLKRNVRTRL